VTALLLCTADSNEDICGRISPIVPLTLVAGVGHMWWVGDWPLLTSLLSGRSPGLFSAAICRREFRVVLGPILATVLCIVGGGWCCRARGWTMFGLCRDRKSVIVGSQDTDPNRKRH